MNLAHWLEGRRKRIKEGGGEARGGRSEDDQGDSKRPADL